MRAHNAVIKHFCPLSTQIESTSLVSLLKDYYACYSLCMCQQVRIISNSCWLVWDGTVDEPSLVNVLVVISFFSLFSPLFTLSPLPIFHLRHAAFNTDCLPIAKSVSSVVVQPSYSSLLPRYIPEQ